MEIFTKTQSDHKNAPTIYLRAVAKLSNPQNEFHSGSVPARLVVRVCDALANEKVLFVQIDVILVLLAAIKLLHAGSYCQKYQSVPYQLNNLNVGYHNYSLERMEKKTLERGEWLTDRHVTAAQMLLKKQFPNINGLQTPL